MRRFRYLGTDVVVNGFLGKLSRQANSIVGAASGQLFDAIDQVAGRFRTTLRRPDRPLGATFARRPRNFSPSKTSVTLSAQEPTAR
jgi:hypothetical protein